MRNTRNNDTSENYDLITAVVQEKIQKQQPKISNKTITPMPTLENEKYIIATETHSKP